MARLKSNMSLTLLKACKERYSANNALEGGTFKYSKTFKNIQHCMATINKDSVWKLVRGIQHTKLNADAKVISAFNHIMISK